MSGISVLIVDDNLEDRQLLLGMISGANLHCHIAEEASGAKGLAAFKKARPDCVFLDDTLDGRPSLDLLESFQRIDSTCPIIVTAANRSEEMAARAFKSGALDYMVKDQVSITEIRVSICIAIEKARVARSLNFRHQDMQRRGRLQALGQLSAGLAHDYNNMLATMRVAIEGVMKDTLSDQSRYRLDVALLTIDRAAARTQNLLGFASQQPGRLSARPCAQILSDLSDLFCDSGESATPVVYRNETSDGSVVCDQAILQDVLLNLLLNARDAIQHLNGSGEITVTSRLSTVREADKTAEMVEFTVADNGQGMDPAVLERSIDPYFTTKGRLGGTGLGLSLAYGFAAQYGGNLTIESTSGVGTVACLRLPVDTGSESTVQALATVHNEPVELHVLLVEDEDLLRVIIEQELVDAGFEVTAVANGHEACEVAESLERVDVLLTDIRMPGSLDGFDVAVAMKKRFSQINTVGLTGFSSFDPERDISSLDVILRKPFRTEDLIEQLRILGSASVH